MPLACFWIVVSNPGVVSLQTSSKNSNLTPWRADALIEIRFTLNSGMCSTPWIVHGEFLLFCVVRQISTFPFPTAVTILLSPSMMCMGEMGL